MISSNALWSYADMDHVLVHQRVSNFLHLILPHSLGCQDYHNWVMHKRRHLGLIQLLTVHIRSINKVGCVILSGNEANRPYPYSYPIAFWNALARYFYGRPQYAAKQMELFWLSLLDSSKAAFCFLLFAWLCPFGLVFPFLECLHRALALNKCHLNYATRLSASECILTSPACTFCTLFTNSKGKYPPLGVDEVLIAVLKTRD